MSNRKIYNEASPQASTSPQHNSKRKRQLNNIIAESKEVRRMENLSLDSVSSIQFCVDGAVGLPASVTATRVTARLMDHKRMQVGEPSASSVSHPDSDCYAPTYDLHAGWRASQLSGTITIVCRIDTLERPSMRPMCVGFSALKLCIDENGIQPSPTVAAQKDRIYLNAGQFLLPIVYGAVPAAGALTETAMDELPHLYDAFLSVRLFDPRAEGEDSVLSPRNNNKNNNNSGSSSSITTRARSSGNQDLGEDRYIVLNSVAHAVVSTLPFAAEGIPQLAINEVLADEIIRNVELDIGEKQIVIRQCMEWLIRLFPPVESNIKLINSRYMLKYEHKMGVYLALDMLYNMPRNQKLIKATRNSIRKMHSKNGIFAKAYDNRITFYKCYFRYLTGSTEPKRLKSSATDLVIDDASVELDYSSREFNPVYNDEYSRTTGFELSPNACVLLVVTVVDVLTSQQHNAGNKPSPYFTAQSTGKIVPELLPRSPSRGDVMSLFTSEGARLEEERNAARAKQEAAFKLRGLVELQIGFDDPGATYWGLLPLMAQSPFTRPAGRKTGGLMRAVVKVKHMQHQHLLHDPTTTAAASHSRENSSSAGESQPKTPSRGSTGATSGGNNSLHNSNSNNSSNNNNNNSSQGKPPFSPRVAKKLNSQFDSSPQKKNTAVAGVATATSNSGSRVKATSSRDANVSPVIPFGMEIDERDGQLKRAASSHEPAPEFFVNAGTHQVPLFTGLPPEEMTRSSNPMAWLLSAISQQKKDIAASSAGCCSSCCCVEQSSSGIVTAEDAAVHSFLNSTSTVSGNRVNSNTSSNSASKKTKSRSISRKHLQLCEQSSSAIVTLVDPRLKSLSQDSLVREKAPSICEETLLRILRVKASKFDEKFGKLRQPTDADLCKYSERYNLNLNFENKRNSLRAYQDAMPANVLPDALIGEINEKFKAKMSE